MAKSTRKTKVKSINQKQDLEQCKQDCSMDNYLDDEDYDDAFKNLLRPIEYITRTNYVDIAHLDLIKELDSYLNHLKISSDGGSSIFVEAALMIQNVNVIYQKKVDEIVDDTVKLISKFQAYRTNKNGMDEATDNVEDKKKKKEKKKYFSSFEPIEIELAPLKKFDCKEINVSTLPPLPKFVLNTNIKVTNKYNRLLPHINVLNGENIGKKYDFKMSGPLNGRLTVNESTNFTCRGNYKIAHCLNYWGNTDSVPMDFMEVEEDNFDEMYLNCPEPAVFDQTISGNFNKTDFSKEVCVANAMSQSPAKLLNASNKVFMVYNAKAWASVVTEADNIYTDKPSVQKNVTKKRKKKFNENNDNQHNTEETYIPSYIPRETGILSSMQQTSRTYADPAFKSFIRAVQKQKRSVLMKLRYQRMKETVEECGPDTCEPKEFSVAVYMGDFDDDNMYGIDGEEPEADREAVRENILTYRKNLEDMAKFEQDEEEMIIEQLAMRKRVQAWHENLRPILDDEEEKGTAFDIHEYGTRILNCFSQIGEKKSFTELFGGMEKEEVARYFLSILMLTNTCNLKVLKPSDGVGEMIIELLKKERHHEQLQVNVGNQVNNE